MTQTDSTNQRFHDITSSPMNFTIHAPGRVNLLGEHTDYNGPPRSTDGDSKNHHLGRR